MKFRFKAFGLHLLGSAIVLTLVLGGLYLGWYRWPGWYLTDVAHVALIFGSVDLTLGPLVTLIIANPGKPRRELARDIAVIVAVQLTALVYGAVTLWNGRPLYYTFSVDRLEIVQASQLKLEEIATARKQNPDFAPDWQSMPRWVWVPLPQDAEESARIATAVMTGSGPDIIEMPRYFKSWDQGLPSLRKQLKTVDQLAIFSKGQRQTLKERMARLGLATDQPNTLFLSGHLQPVLAVFDQSNLRIKAFIRAD
jgi:hypothetical protein